MKLSLSEILTKVEEAPSLEAKVQVLRTNYSQALADVLQGCFDDRIRWLLPEGRVEYKAQQAVGSEGNIYNETRRLYLFVEGGHPSLSQARRETLFVQLLEQVCPADAELLLAIKDKFMPFPSMTVELFRAAYPNIKIEHDPKAKRTAAPLMAKPVTELPDDLVWTDAPPMAETAVEPPLAVPAKPKRVRAKTKSRRKTKARARTKKKVTPADVQVA
jgi:hypothetical protein